MTNQFGAKISASTPGSALFAALALFATFVRADAPQGQYSIPGDGTVVDARTQLTWQLSVPLSTYKWDEATQYCSSLSLAGGGWRLPSVNELQTIVDDTRQGPAIDTSVFSGTPSDNFWTSTPLVGSGGGSSWYVAFFFGTATTDFNTTMYRVRCVR